MKKLLQAAFVTSSAFFILSCGDNAEKTDTTIASSTDTAMTVNKDVSADAVKTNEDAEWAAEVADAGMLEVKLGQLALQHSTSQKVKDLAKMIVDDHTKANEELMAAAKQKNIVLPATMTEKCQKKYDELATKTGKDFDKAYADAMVDDHKDAIDNFKKEAENGKDADLKQWASGKLPALAHHLDMAKKTKESIK